MMRKFFQVTMLLVVLTLTSLVPASAQSREHDRWHRRGRRTVFVNNRNPTPGIPRRVRRGFFNRQRDDNDRFRVRDRRRDDDRFRDTDRRRGRDRDRNDNRERDHDGGRDHGGHGRH
jgi:hypothetical protein